MLYVLCFLFVWISWITITVMGSFLSCSGCGGCGVTFKKGNNSGGLVMQIFFGGFGGGVTVCCVFRFCFWLCFCLLLFVERFLMWVRFFFFSCTNVDLRVRTLGIANTGIG